MSDEPSFSLDSLNENDQADIGVQRKLLTQAMEDCVHLTEENNRLTIERNVLDYNLAFALETLEDIARNAEKDPGEGVDEVVNICCAKATAWGLRMGKFVAGKKALEALHRINNADAGKVSSTPEEK